MLLLDQRQAVAQLLQRAANGISICTAFANVGI
jgi:hypothetical protein